ncbi:MAG: flagellar export protein FliJ [Thermoguttaceae bacterium]
MAAFKFRLVALQKIRENIRRDKQAELVKAYEAAKIVEDQIETVKNELVSCIESGREMLQGGKISIDYLLSMRRREAFLITQQKHAESQLEQIQQEIERRRIAVMEADREVKVLEKLEEKLRDRHQREAALAELKQMDEIAGRPKTNII